MAARPLGTSANFNPADGDRKPGNLPVILGQSYTIGQCKVIMYSSKTLRRARCTANKISLEHVRQA